MSTIRSSQRQELERVADAIISQLDGKVVAALPLGLGKPVALLDVLLDKIASQPGRSLTILTALSLERPTEPDPVRGRLLNPVFDRLFAHYTEPRYLKAQRDGTLPDNVIVREFYFKPGSRIGNVQAQRDYISANYTHAARDVAAQGCNLVMQLLAEKPDAPDLVSMSCNPDTSAELVRRLREAGQPCIAVGVVHPDLPYMFGDAEVSRTQFDFLLREDDARHGLFAVPRLAPIPDVDYAIGIHASALVVDGGTLQLGIGAMGDAIVQALILRHQNNETYRRLLARFDISGRYSDLLDEFGGDDTFEQGLYSATEMFVEGFLHLYQAGILKREVYDFWALQQLINLGLCNPQHIDGSTLRAMAELGVRELRGKDFERLQYHGYFNEQTGYAEGHLIAPDGQRFAANMANPDSQQIMAAQCLGKALRNGKVLHGGFFLGSEDFYRSLRELPEEQRSLLAMGGVEKINQLDVNPRLFKAQRRRARFINTGLNVSLNGAVASDTLESGQVISGVGGQYNFVAMAHQLPESRSVLMIRASRQDHGKAVSNILSHYGACTIPRHLRDIVITEYGIADLRSKTDEQVAQALIAIADSRFQDELRQQAIDAGKLSKQWCIPEYSRGNAPARVREVVSEFKDHLPAYPFGCDFLDVELRAAKALQSLAATSLTEKLSGLLQAPGISTLNAEKVDVLRFLNLDSAQSVHERVLARLVRHALHRGGDAG